MDLTPENIAAETILKISERLKARKEITIAYSNDFGQFQKKVNTLIKRTTLYYEELKERILQTEPFFPKYHNTENPPLSTQLDEFVIQISIFATYYIINHKLHPTVSNGPDEGILRNFLDWARGLIKIHHQSKYSNELNETGAESDKNRNKTGGAKSSKLKMRHFNDYNRYDRHDLPLYMDFTAFSMMLDVIYYEIEGKKHESAIINKIITDILRTIHEIISIAEAFKKNHGILPLLPDFIGGMIFESLQNYKKRKRFGVYYTPFLICSIMVKRSLWKYFRKDLASIIDDSNAILNPKNLHSLIERIFRLRVLDPAIGSGHFLAVFSEELARLLYDLIHITSIVHSDSLNLIIDPGIIEPADSSRKEKPNHQKDGFFLNIFKERDSSRIKHGSGLKVKISNKNTVIFILKKYIIIPNILYGFDVSENAVRFSRARLMPFLPGYSGPEPDETGINTEHLTAPNSDVYEVQNVDHLFCANFLITERELEIYINQQTLDRAISNLDNYVSNTHKKSEEDSIRQLYKILRPMHESRGVSEAIHEGFDIIIGNPPYIKQENIDGIIPQNLRRDLGFSYKDLLVEAYSEKFRDAKVDIDRRADLSVYFILRSMQILKAGGLHSFIITNKWARTQYGEFIRKYLTTKGTILEIMDFSGIALFPGANVDVFTYIIKNMPSSEDTSFTYLGYRPSNRIISQPVEITFKMKNFGAEPWIFIDPQSRTFFEGIKRVFKPLRQLGPEIYFGIKTGFNKAFIIDDDARQKIVEINENDKNRIIPILFGRDIFRYNFKWRHTYLIFFPKGFTNDFLKEAVLSEERPFTHMKRSFPGIFSHFMQYFDRDIDTAEIIGKDGNHYKRKRTTRRRNGLLLRKDMGDFWWELRACSYYEVFKKKRIIWREIVSEPSFMYISLPFFSDATTFTLVWPHYEDLLKPLVLILNSSISWFIIKQIGTELGYNTARYKKDYTGRIPVPDMRERWKYNDFIRSSTIIVDYLQLLKEFLACLDDLKNKNKIKEIFGDKEIKNILGDWNDFSGLEREIANLYTYFNNKIGDLLVFELYLSELRGKKRNLSNILPNHLTKIDTEEIINEYLSIIKDSGEYPAERASIEFLRKSLPYIKKVEKSFQSIINDNFLEKRIKELISDAEHLLIGEPRAVFKH